MTRKSHPSERERDYRAKDVVAGNALGRLPKAPNTPIVGFVPVVPARKKLDHSVEAIRAAVAQAVADGRPDVCLSYDPHFCANYYGLRRALGEEVARIRGGWFAPMYGEFVLAVDFWLKQRENPVGYKRPPRGCDRTHRCDVENMTETFLDALARPWAVVTPRNKPSARKPVRTLADNCKFAKVDASKHVAGRRDMAGVWFALCRIEPDEDEREVARFLSVLLDQELAKRRNDDELRKFDRQSLARAKEDGDDFLIRCGLDPVDRNRRA